MKNRKNDNDKKLVDENKQIPVKPQPENYRYMGYNIDYNKLEILDYKEKPVECSLFGVPLIKFKNDSTGILSFDERINLKLINDIPKNKDKLQYIPQVVKLEGSFSFPRPLSIPFYNEENNKNSKNKKKLAKILNKSLNIKNIKNKRILENTNKNSKLLDYLCIRLSNKDKEGKNKLIKLINHYVENKKKENYKKHIDNDSSINCLLDYKKRIVNNYDDNQYDGHIINKSVQKDIYKRYNILSNVINNYTNKTCRNKNIDVNSSIYKELYKNINDYNENKKRKAKDLFNDSKIFSQKNLNKTTNFSLSNNNLMNKSMDLNQNQILLLNRSNISNNTLNEYINILSTNNKGSKGKNIRSLNLKNFLASSFTNSTINESNSLSNKNKNNSLFNIRNPNPFIAVKNFNPSTNISNGPSDNISFISKNDNYKDVNNKIKSNANFIQEFLHEKKLTNGYTRIPIIERTFYRYKKPHYKSPLEIYKKEDELMKKVNHIAYKRERERELFQEKMIMHKKQNQKIFELNNFSK